MSKAKRKRYEIQAETNSSDIRVIGWSDQPDAFEAAVRLHPGLRRRIVIDRADQAHEREGDR